MKTTIFLALIAAVALTSGVQGAKLPFFTSTTNSNSTPNLGSSLFNYVEAFYAIMPCGYAPWGIPKLAPFTLANYNLNFINEYYGLTGNVSNIVVTGLNGLGTQKYNYDPVAQKLSFDIIFNDIQLLAEYTMNAWTFIAGTTARVGGNGPLNWQIKDFRIIGDFVITTSNTNPNGLMMTDSNIKFFIGDVLPNNWNYQWDISFNNFFNRWVREFILMWSEEVQGQELNSIYNALVLPIVNNVLNYVNMEQLIAFFVEETNLLNASDC